MHRVNRCTLAGTAWARPALTSIRLTIARSQGAHHAAPPPAPLGLRFRALLGLGFVPPPEPRPCAHCASIAYALLPAARVPLCRHRADPESSSRSLPSGSPARLARIAPTACRHPHPSMPPSSRSRAHRPPIAPTVRRHPHRAPSLSSRCGGPRALTGKNRTVCIPFSPNARKRPPSWQHPPEMHAFRDQDGNILAPCIHSRVQSGDSGYMARESCRQGPFFASRNPKSRMARRCCQRRPAFLRQQPAVRRNGLCALRRGPGLLAACAPPVISLVPAAARVHRRRLARVALRRPHRAHRAPPSAASPIAVGVSADRALPAALVLPTPTYRAHRCALAGTARAPTRANRAPAPCQPDPSPEPTESRPPVEPSASTRAPPPAAPHPAARVPLRFR